MNGLQTLHFTVLAVWGGVLACEGILEFLMPARTFVERKQVARLHFFIDMLVEGPLLILIATTGTILVIHTKLSFLVEMHLAAGLLVIIGSAACILFVAKRHLQIRYLSNSEDSVTEHALNGEKLNRVIHNLIYAFTPLGVGAFALGIWLIR